MEGDRDDEWIRAKHCYGVAAEREKVAHTVGQWCGKSANPSILERIDK
jgi:hypothetical protein